MIVDMDQIKIPITDGYSKTIGYCSMEYPIMGPIKILNINITDEQWISEFLSRQPLKITNISLEDLK